MKAFHHILSRREAVEWMTNMGMIDELYFGELHFSKLYKQGSERCRTRDTETQ